MNIVGFTTYCKKFVIIKVNPLSLIRIRLDKIFIMHTLKAHINLNFCSAFVLVSCKTKCAIIPEIVQILCTVHVVSAKGFIKNIPELYDRLEITFHLDFS